MNDEPSADELLAGEIHLARMAFNVLLKRAAQAGLTVEVTALSLCFESPPQDPPAVELRVDITRRERIPGVWYTESAL